MASFKKIMRSLFRKKRQKTNPNHGVACSIMDGTLIDNVTKLGNYCYIGRYCSLTKVDIGHYCSIANNVSIGQGEHDLSLISTHAVFYDDAFDVLTKKPCSIGHDVWIGVDAVVLRGVKIGNGAVIGANSVVTKDVPPYAIVVGSPARIIKYRFTQEKINAIEESQWWLEDVEHAKKKFEALSAL